MPFGKRRLPNHQAWPGVVAPVPPAPPPSIPRVFFGEDLVPFQAVNPLAAPALAKVDFLAAVSNADTWNFEINQDNAYATLPFTFTGAQAGLQVTLTAVSPFVIRIMTLFTDGSGRFDTTLAGGGKFARFTDSMTFNCPVGTSAFGFYGTDWGDFNGQMFVTFTDMLDAELTFMVPHTVGAPNGSLIFWGFVHPGVLYKKVKFFCTYVVPPAPGEEDYFGVDDIIVGVAI